MSVKMRLTRLGDKKSPFYRIVVIDSRKARDGAYFDLIGTYNPLTQPATINIDAEKAKNWISKGVQPTDTVRALLVQQGILEGKKLKPKAGKDVETKEKQEKSEEKAAEEVEEKATETAEEKAQ